MPRDLSGNMTLPAGNPVVTGTAISSTVMNNTLADLAAEVQDSLSRSGKGGMSAAFKNADGTEAAPGLTFTNETNTGWFRYAAGVVRMSILGAWKFAFSAAGLVIKGTLGLLDATGTKTVTVTAPAGLAADYTLTAPAALPGSTLPVTMTSAGVLSTAQLVNSQQNFGTPSASTDVVILSYLATTNASLTSVNANITNPPTVSARAAIGLAWFKQANNPISIGGAITGCGAGGDPTSATSLWTVPSGYRPVAAGSQNILIPVVWYDASGSTARYGGLVFNTANNNMYFWAANEAGTKYDLAAGDQIYYVGANWQTAD